MALTDPQVITINTVDNTCNSVEPGPSRTVYSTADENVKITVSHQSSRNRTRHMERVDKRVVATDPLSSEQEYKTLGVYLVIDEPEYGFTDDEIDYVVQGFTARLTTAHVKDILSGQH